MKTAIAEALAAKSKSQKKLATEKLRRAKIMTKKVEKASNDAQAKAKKELEAAKLKLANELAAKKKKDSHKAKPKHGDKDIDKLTKLVKKLVPKKAPHKKPCSGKAAIDKAIAKAKADQLAADKKKYSAKKSQANFSHKVKKVKGTTFASNGSSKSCWAGDLLKRSKFDSNYSISKCWQGSPNLKNGRGHGFGKVLLDRCFTPDKDDEGNNMYEVQCRGFYIISTRICKRSSSLDCAVISFKQGFRNVRSEKKFEMMGFDD
jgi:hypothetical protein